MDRIWKWGIGSVNVWKLEWVRLLRGTGEEIARKVQATGLVQTAEIISGILGKPAPGEEEIPSWIQEILASVAGRLCEYEEELPGFRESGALEASLGFVAAMPPSTRVEFQSLLVIVEIAPFVFGPRRRRFTELRENEQSAHLAGWEQAAILPRRGAFRALKSVVMMGYWSRPAVFSHLGYSVATNRGVPGPQREQWISREREDDDE